MIVTFPHFAQTWVALKALFDKHNIPCIVPPKSSKRSLSLGVRYSPEGLCLPYKMLLGNIIEGLEQGADTVIHVGGSGMCRLGYYSKLQEQALLDLGYKFKMVTFDWQDLGIVGLVKTVRRALDTDKPWLDVAGDVKFGLQQLILMDDLERKVHYVRPRESDKGAASRIWRTAGDRVSAAHSPEALRRVKEDLFGELDAIPQDSNAEPLKVGFVGEFFLAVDQFGNMDLEEVLGKMGVEIVRSAYLMEWAKVWLFLEFVGMSHGQKMRAAAKGYLNRDVSGDAISTVGETILHQKDGFDGIVHIQPFTCLPEIVAQNILPKVTKDYEIPIMTLIMDEQMGKAGIQTRLEAFVDLMWRRRRAGRAAVQH